MISWPCLISPSRQKQQHLAALQCPVFSCLARKLLMFTYTLGLPLFGLALRSCQTRQKVMRGMQWLLFCFPKILSSSFHQPVTQQQPCGALLMDAHTHRDKDKDTDTQTHRHTDTQTHRHTDTQTHRHTDTQTHRHTDTQTHRHTHTHTHTLSLPATNTLWPET